MQLSEDGNFQWDGNQWVPVEQAAAPAAPIAVSPHAAAPVAAAPATVMVSGSSSGGGLDFTRGFSTLKYGFAAFINSIVTVILMGIVWVILFFAVIDSESTAVYAIGAMFGVMFNILAVTQMMTLIMGMGIGDGLGKSGLGYVGSWKTAGVAILEAAPVIVVASLFLIIGLVTEGTMAGLMLLLGGVILLLFQFGLVAFMARKVAEGI